jgi:hypothetical protein
MQPPLQTDVHTKCRAGPEICREMGEKWLMAPGAAQLARSFPDSAEIFRIGLSPLPPPRVTAHRPRATFTVAERSPTGLPLRPSRPHGAAAGTTVTTDTTATTTFLVTPRSLNRRHQPHGEACHGLQFHSHITTP